MFLRSSLGRLVPLGRRVSIRQRVSLCLLVLLLGANPAAAQAASLAESAPTDEEIRAAVIKLRDDKDLGSEHIVRSLRWVDSQSPTPPPGAPAWIVGFFQFLGQAGSLLMWGAGAVAGAVGAVWIFRLLKARASKAAFTRPVMTSRVGELDIRPNSLPDDIGTAALALLQAGRSRDALSLLYRGALSRAVHRFGVTVTESFTEAEARRAVDARFDRPRAEYFGELVDLWQRVVYAGQTAAVDPVAALCKGFAPAFDASAP